MNDLRQEPLYNFNCQYCYRKGTHTATKQHTCAASREHWEAQRKLREQLV